jgi:hypothetical protein
MPMRPVRPVSALHASHDSSAVLPSLPTTARPVAASGQSTIETLQATVLKIEELLRRQRLRHTVQATIPVRPTLPPTVGPAPCPSAAACSDCRDPQISIDDTDRPPRSLPSQPTETTCRPALERLRARVDQFAAALYQSAPELPACRRPVVSATGQASPTVSSRSASPTASASSSAPRSELGHSFHRSLEPSPEPDLRPMPTENPSSGFFPQVSRPASPTPSFTDKMGYLTVQLADRRRVIYRAYQRDNNT